MLCAIFHNIFYTFFHFHMGKVHFVQFSVFLFDTYNLFFYALHILSPFSLIRISFLL